MVTDVLPPGTPAVMNGDIHVHITAVTIRSSGLLYEVSWYVGAERRTAWVEPFEITTDTPPTRIGFKQ